MLACCLFALAASVTAAPLVFDPEVGTEVPYRFETTVEGTYILPGMGAQPFLLYAEGEYTDRVEQIAEGNARILTRTFKSVRVGETKDNLQEAQGLEELPPVPYVRDERGRLISVAEIPADELPPFPFDPMTQSADPVILTFFQQIVIPYPEGDVAVGTEWDAGPDLNIVQGITAIQAPSTVAEITQEAPRFAVIESTVSLMAENSQEVPMGEQGGTMQLTMRYGTEMAIKQWSALANGLVARTEASGKGRLEVLAGQGDTPAVTGTIDKIETLVTYDEEAGS
jgi:hypothetical protein